MDEFKKIITELLKNNQLIDGIISNKRKSSSIYEKIKIKPLIIKEDKIFQFEYFDEKKVIHKNLNSDEACEEILNLMKLLYKQGVFYSQNNDIHVLSSKKFNVKILKKSPSKKIPENYFSHNRVKNYILNEGEYCDFLFYLGIMDSDGKVKNKKYDKFRQINRYLELIKDCISKLDKNKVIKIIDFGCGKAYLTFALYYYLVNILKFDVDIIGLDLKEEVINKCNLIAKELGYEKLAFEIGDINEYSYEEKIDMVISLHACDTATDASIAKAIAWNADVILAVPCCQHEFLHKIHNENMKLIENHGILKERLSAILTDGLRANVMEIMGYKTDIFEFIDMEHTPKNLVIRGIKRGISFDDDIKNYLAFKKYWNINPEIEDMIGESFKKKVKI